jgi:hypothetical protein
MDRLFLDANILFSAAYRPDAGLAQFWKLKNAILCSSHYALEEARMNLAENAQRRRLTNLARRIRLFDAAPRRLPRGLSLPGEGCADFACCDRGTRDTSHYGRRSALRAVLRQANRRYSRSFTSGLSSVA